MRVIIAEDSVLLREGIARLLTENGFTVVATVEDGEALIRRTADLAPDVAVIDIRMPPSHTDEGLRAAVHIRAHHPDVGVLLLSQHAEVGIAMKLLEGGADGAGYLLKDRIADVEEFAAAVRRVGEGGSALDPTIVSQLVRRRRENDRLEILSTREREVLKLIGEGLSNQAIAHRLVVSQSAVEKHVSSIFDKLQLPSTKDTHRRVLAVLAVLRH
jgi:DNA-binding NarL/FixJ family response regulator